MLSFLLSLHILIKFIYSKQGYPPLAGSIGWSPGFKPGDQPLNSFQIKVIFPDQGYPPLAGSIGCSPCLKGGDQPLNSF